MTAEQPSGELTGPPAETVELAGSVLESEMAEAYEHMDSLKTLGRRVKAGSPLGALYARAFESVGQAEASERATREATLAGVKSVALAFYRDRDRFYHHALDGGDLEGLVLEVGFADHSDASAIASEVRAAIKAIEEEISWEQ